MDSDEPKEQNVRWDRRSLQRIRGTWGGELYAGMLTVDILNVVRKGAAHAMQSFATSTVTTCCYSVSMCVESSLVDICSWRRTLWAVAPCGLGSVVE